MAQYTIISSLYGTIHYYIQSIWRNTLLYPVYMAQYTSYFPVYMAQYTYYNQSV